MRGYLAGRTDFGHQSFRDVNQDLGKLAKNFCQWHLELADNVGNVNQPYWETVPDDFRGVVAETLTLLETTCVELSDISAGISVEVLANHPVRLKQLAGRGRALHEDWGQVWHADYMSSFKDPRYGDPDFAALQQIYSDGRGSVIRLLDLDSMGERLGDFVGRREAVPRWRKVRQGLADHARAIVLTVIAGLLVAYIAYQFGWIG